MKYTQYIAKYTQALQNKKPREALKYIREAVLTDPKQIEGWDKLAHLYLVEFHKIEDAIRALTKGLKIHAGNKDLLMLLNKAYFDQQKYHDALTGIMQILKQDQHNTDAWELIDKIYIASKSLQPQIDNFRKGLFEKLVQAGRQALDQSQIKQAITSFEQAIQIIPSNEEVMDELSRLYFRMQNYAASQIYVQQLVLLHSKDVHFLNLKAYNAWKLQNYNEAYDAFTLSLKIMPNQQTLTNDLEDLKSDLTSHLLTDAQQSFTNNEYQQALSKYQEVMKYSTGNSEAIQGIRESETNLKQQQQEQRENDTQNVLIFLRDKIELNEENSFESLLKSMPSHIDVEDEYTLQILLAFLIKTGLIQATLTSTGLILKNTPIIKMSLKEEEIESHTIISPTISSDTLAMRNLIFPIMVLRDGFVNSNQYLFSLKIQNNRSKPIFDIKIFIYYPDNCLNLQDPNPESIQSILAGKNIEINFHFRIQTSILEGMIQAIMIFLDENNELQSISISPHVVENFSGNLTPLRLDPGSFARVLQESQTYTSHEDHFNLSQSGNDLITKVQRELELMNVHVQQVSRSNQSDGFNAIIHGISQPTQLDKPLLLEIGLNQKSTQDKTEVKIKTSSISNELNRALGTIVKSSILMPHCISCGQIFPIALYPKYEKGESLICEYCGSIFSNNQTG